MPILKEISKNLDLEASLPDIPAEIQGSSVSEPPPSTWLRAPGGWGVNTRQRDAPSGGFVVALSRSALLERALFALSASGLVERVGVGVMVEVTNCDPILLSCPGLTGAPSKHERIVSVTGLPAFAGNDAGEAR